MTAACNSSASRAASVVLPAPPGPSIAISRVATPAGARDAVAAWMSCFRESIPARTRLLVGPPAALAIDVFAPSLPEIGRADDEDLKAFRPSLVASPRTGRDADRVPFLELDDLVVELHPTAPAEDHVHLLLRLVRVAVRKAIAGRDALVAQGGLLERKRLGRRAELQRRRAGEPRAD